ncbi:MAG: DUF2059 domain-containing protein [Chthoniobacterales bacterium]
MKKQILKSGLLIAICLQSASAIAATDTPETRRREAERYLQATPPKAMFEDMADKMAVNLPPAEREKFKQMLTSQLDIAALTKAMADALVKHFTTEELKALADFYGSPVGKSAMQKFGAYNGRPDADDARRDYESAGKSEPITPESIAALKIDQGLDAAASCS